MSGDCPAVTVDSKWTVEQALVDVMPDKRLDLDGLPPLERRQGTTRKAWDHDRLVPLVVRLALDPDGTGEFPTDPIDVMDRVVGALTKVYPFTPGRVSVQIHEEAAR